MNVSDHKNVTAVNVEHAKTSPASEFERPIDVVKSNDLTDEDKKKILDQWEIDAQGLSRANDEGMGDVDTSQLADVNDARRRLSKDDRDGSSATHDRRTSGKPQP